MQLAIAVLGGLAIITLPGCGSSLYSAAKNGNYKAAERYIEQGEDINAGRAGDGRTPIHAASERGQRKMVTVLMNHGAFVDARDNEGNTPLDLARRAKRPTAARVLIELAAEES